MANLGFQRDHRNTVSLRAEYLFERRGFQPVIHLRGSSMRAYGIDLLRIETGICDCAGHGMNSGFRIGTSIGQAESVRTGGVAADLAEDLRAPGLCFFQTFQDERACTFTAHKSATAFRKRAARLCCR